MTAQVGNVALKIPPHSVEAEQSVIGALLIDNSSWEAVADVVRASDFYRDDHRRVFGHIARLIDSGIEADIVTVFEAVKRANEVDQVGGLAYLGEIASNTPSSANARRYAEIVADRAQRRALLAVSCQIANLADGAGPEGAQQRIDEALGRVMALAEARPSSSEPELVSEVLPGVVDQLNQLYEQGGATSGLSTGFGDLDRMTTGLHPGDMVIVAGRPAMGKTAFAMNLAENCALGADGVALVFSMEMTKAEMTKRLMASIGRIELSRLRNGRLLDDDWDKFSVALSKLNDAKIVIDETGGLTLAQIRSRARRTKRQQGRLDLVVIDYIQMMEAGGHGGENRNAELTQISRGIKAMAKELRVPVVALSQLSRKVEERTNKRPVLSDLRESGALEQDADLILMLYRDEYYKPDTDNRGIAEVLIAKQRSGPTGDVHLAFRGEISRFSNLAYGDRPVPAVVAPKAKGRGFREGA